MMITSEHVHYEIHEIHDEVRKNDELRNSLIKRITELFIRLVILRFW